MKTIAIMVAFGLLTLVFFWDVIVDDRYLIDIDPGLYDPWRSYPAEAGEPGGSLQPDSFLSYYPAGASLNQSIASGRFHLWNPRILGGMPFLANPQTRATYPLRLMLARADPARAMGYDVAIHVFLAMVGMYLFLTSLGLRAPGAFLGAVAFAFSSFFYVRYGHPTIIGAAAWMPFFFYSLQVALKRERLGIVLLTASLAMGYLAGFPQVFLFGVLALALYAFYLALDCPSGERRRALSKTVRIIGVSGLLSALIVSIQLIPFLELYTNSVGLHYDFEYIAKFLMIPPVLMLRSIFPAFFGQPAQGTDWSGLTRDAAHPYNPEYAVYGGIGALIVALAALPLLRKSPHVRVMVLLLVLGVAVAVSRPVARIGYLLLPMLRASRVSRVAVIPCFSLAALAAIGFSGLAGGEGLGGKKRIFLAAGAVTLFAVLFAAYIQFAGAPVVEKLAEKAQTIPGDVWEETHVLVRSGTIREWAQGDTARWLGYERRVLSRQLVIIALSATVLILLAAWPNRRHRVVIAVLFVLVAVYDLLGTARAYRVSQPPGSAPETPGITALKGVLGDQGQWRIKAFQPKVGDRLPFPPNTNQIFGISSLQGTHTINTKSFDAYRETYVDSKMEPAVGEAVIPTVGTGITWLANRLDDLMGIRCVIAERGESRYAASSILRSVLDKKVTSARLKMLRLDGDNKLALLQASGETLAFKARFLPVRSLCFSMGFDSQAGAPGDSVSFTLTCDGETGNARLERAFDRLHDAGKWHEATLDIGPIGLSMVDMELSVEVAGSGDPVMAGWAVSSLWPASARSRGPGTATSYPCPGRGSASA